MDILLEVTCTEEIRTNKSHEANKGEITRRKEFLVADVTVVVGSVHRHVMVHHCLNQHVKIIRLLFMTMMACLKELVQLIFFVLMLHHI